MFKPKHLEQENYCIAPLLHGSGQKMLLGDVKEKIGRKQDVLRN